MDDERDGALVEAGQELVGEGDFVPHTCLDTDSIRRAYTSRRSRVLPPAPTPP